MISDFMFYLQLGEINRLSDDFFTLDQEKKDPFRKKPGGYSGYTNIEEER